MWLLRAQMIDNLQMNFVSTAMMCKAVIPGMKERGFGRIINMVSDPEPHQKALSLQAA